MSTIDSGDLEATGYFLPGDGRLRLKKLREHVAFLANLARSRTSDKAQQGAAGIRVDEAVICLELLAEQIGQVLDELAWPAARGPRAATQTGDTEPAAAEVESAKPEAMEPEALEEEADDTGARYLFGVTLDQIDAINLLLDMIRAHGDVVIASDDAEFADHTLSLIGHAIFCDAQKLRDIISDVNAQWLGPARSMCTGVREEPAAYCARPVRFPMPGAWRIAGQVTTYQ
ncbi:hypothetical protein [Rhodanobacter sp. DHG33]|uniref:XAC0095 family protein n=1 Tax=Rhodanobacter sp. DHG33 TaxID=2775921 RepID=UPI0017839720|nr:hypothetical protein [Rhodanobacter sp. DHG33]MBD8900179.1 hypothetical protein [Rhodanobacter sp. DHG33]